MAKAKDRASCIGECQRRLRDKVKICDDLFNSPGSVYYHNTAWHTTCLANARSEYDACIAICKAEYSQKYTHRAKRPPKKLRS